MILLLVLAFLRFSLAFGSSTSVADDALHALHQARTLKEESFKASKCCSLLKKRLGGMKVSFPGSQNYTTQQNGLPLRGYWSQQEAALMPSCRVAPAHSTDVAYAVDTLAQNQCKFAVRSGGHAAFAGAANIDSTGIAIDLSTLDQVELSNENTIAKVGGGARWQKVYATLDPLGVSVSGGRVESVGVGGLTTGGGKSYFASKYGFACDGVSNFELVTGKGKILNVNEKSHPDLFRALKGGSNNFGIVTRFDLKTFPQGDMWAGSIVMPVKTLDRNLDALFHLTEASSQNKTAGDAQVIFAYVTLGQATGATKFISNFLSYTLPEPNPKILSNFTSIQPQQMSTVRVGKLGEFAKELNEGTPNGRRQLVTTATFKNHAGFTKELLKKSDSLFDPIVAANATGFLISTVLQPLTKPMLAPGCGTNSLGLCPSDGNLLILDLGIAWASPSDDDKVERAARALVDWTNHRAKQLGIFHRYVYLNYALPSQKTFSSYGRDNYQRLIAASKKYDPEQVFQKLVPGGIKLSSG